MEFDIIIIGSGPAATAAAQALSHKNVAIIDVGTKENRKLPNKNFYNSRDGSKESVAGFIGNNSESLSGIIDGIMPKVRGPYRRFITEDYYKVNNITTQGFEAETSLAYGGLANAWGGQMYKYNDHELSMMGLNPKTLKTYYDKLTKEIGISGENDDLNEFYGTADNNLPAIDLNRTGKKILETYKKNRKYFNHKNIYIGKPRLAVLSQNHKNRKACDYNNLDFYQSHLDYLYTPRLHLDQMIAKKHVTYYSGLYVENYKETKNNIKITAKELKTNRYVTFTSKKLLLAAGSIGSAKIVLNSNNDFSSKLPILENRLSYIPFLLPGLIGSAFETHSYYTQINLIYKNAYLNDHIMGSFYALNGLYTSEFLCNLPFSIKENLRVAKYFMPALAVLHLWYPCKASKENNLSLNINGKIHINFSNEKLGQIEQHILRSFMRKRIFSMQKLCQYPIAGKSFHYAGTLPNNPNYKYHTDQNGKLNNCNNVYAIDGSNFNYLPAKNLSFTIMANAMRIADYVKKQF